MLLGTLKKKIVGTREKALKSVVMEVIRDGTGSYWSHKAAMLTNSSSSGSGSLESTFSQSST